MLVKKYHLLLLLLFSILFINCNPRGKSVDPAAENDQYYIECKINGELKKFNFDLRSVRYLESDGREIGINGKIKKMEKEVVPSFGIQIGSYQSGIQLTTGTYSTSVKPVFLLADYANGSVFQYGSMTDQDFTVVVSQLNKTYVKGTFAGKLKDRVNGGFITVTEGKFYVNHCVSNC
jgi:hypothetical protein